MLAPRKLYNTNGVPKTYIIDRGHDGRIFSKPKNADLQLVSVTLHDRRAYFVSHFRAKYKKFPELHADPGATARLDDSAKVMERKSM